MKRALPKIVKVKDEEGNATHIPNTFVSLGGMLVSRANLDERNDDGWWKYAVNEVFLDAGLESIDGVPELYETDGREMKDVNVQYCFRIPQTDAIWYVFEMDKATGECFGFVALFNDGFSGEQGYFRTEDISEYSRLSGSLPVMENYTESKKPLTKEEVITAYKTGKYLF